jgi:thermitase
VVNRLTFAPNLYEVRTTAAQDALAASVALHDNPDFVFAEPSFVEHIPARFRPDDPDYTRQWQWNNTGEQGGTAGADVHIEEAWDTTRGAGVRVAVIDNGFDTDHEDLASGVAASSGFYRPGGPVTEFVAGPDGMPDFDHGTFCAGMVGARGGARGGVGAAPECELMLIACLGDQVGTQTTLARAVAYAADPRTEDPTADPDGGADILVSSLGPNGADWDLTSTLDLALTGAAAAGRGGRGLAIFWAASNGHDVDVLRDEVVSHPDVIAVVRSDRNDQEDNAARGPEVELIAPGVDVFSTESGNGYGTSTGTSFAAPCAAGCAALALAVAPDLTRDELRTLVRETADKIGGVTYDESGHNDDYGFGRVNASALVARAAGRC